MGHLTSILHRDSHPWLWMTMDRAVSEKYDRITWHSEWIPRLDKFSEMSLQAFSSWNRMWRGVRSEEDVPKRRGFQDEVDLHLGVGMEMGRGRARGWDLRPHPAWLLPFPIPAPWGLATTHPAPPLIQFYIYK